MEYSKLVELYEKLESNTKRLAKTYEISELLKEVPSDDLQIILLMVQGRIFPPWDERKIGVASRLILKAISVSAGVETKKVEDEWKKTGDLGQVAFNLVGKKKQATLFSAELSVKKVFDNIQKIASIEGKGAVDRKLSLIKELLTSAKPGEAKYIVRMVLEDLRVGVGDGTLRDAIVWAFFPKIENIHSKCTKCNKIVPRGLMKECLACGNKFEKVVLGDLTSLNHFENSKGFIDKLTNGELKTDELYVIDKEERESYNFMMEAVQSAFDVTNDFSVVATAIKKGGLKELGKISLHVGVPLKVMLYPKAKDIEDAFSIVGKPAAFEYKYDGFRMQIHKENGKVEIFTRRLENVTKQFPEIAEYVKNNVDAKSFVLDSEAVGYNSKTGKYMPFQEISQRIRRKYDIEKTAKELPVELNVFDLIAYEGKNMVKEHFLERRKILEKIIKQVPKKIVIAEQIITDNLDEAEKFYQESLRKGNEGVMVKNLEGIYKPGSRVGYGVKVKPTMDSMDLVIVAAEWGTGKRAGWLSSFTLACIDDGEYLEIGKVGTGMKEKAEEEGVKFEEMTELLKPLILSEKGRDVTVKPKIVFEIKFEEIQKSPTYSSGYALRFPRVIRIRDDRRPEEINTLNEVEDVYYNQKKR